MKVLIDVPDDKADFIIEVLHYFSFLKATAITEHKAHLLDEIDDSVDLIKILKKDKIKSKKN